MLTALFQVRGAHITCTADCCDNMLCALTLGSVQSNSGKVGFQGSAFELCGLAAARQCLLKVAACWVPYLLQQHPYHETLVGLCFTASDFQVFSSFGTAGVTLDQPSPS